MLHASHYLWDHFLLGKQALILDGVKELLHLIDLLDLLHEYVLCDLGEFSEVFPLRKQFGGLAIDEEPGSIKVLAGQRDQSHLVVEVLVQVGLGNVVELPALHLLAQVRPILVDPDLCLNQVLSLVVGELSKLFLVDCGVGGQF